MKRVIVLIPMLLLLCSCENAVRLLEGEIYEKVYEPAGVQTTYITDSEGRSVPRVISNAAKWKVRIRFYDLEKERWYKSTYTVTGEQYDSVGMGDMVRFSKIDGTNSYFMEILSKAEPDWYSVSFPESKESGDDLYKELSSLLVVPLVFLFLSFVVWSGTNLLLSLPARDKAQQEKRPSKPDWER